MPRIKVPAFWQAVLVLVALYLFLDNAFPPLMPVALMFQYMVIGLVAVLLYFSFDDTRWEEFKGPVFRVVRDDNRSIIRWFFMLAIPVLLAYVTYGFVKPNYDSPVELRQVHPAPPSSLKVFGNRYDLSTLENPVRQAILEQMKDDEEGAWETYHEAVAAGQEVYYQNCFFCHGDLLDGVGHFAEGFNPLPANFQDVGTIAQLQEAFLFWRITTGGPGLPKEGTPWNSAMPVWHEMLDEEEVWNTILFLYDYVGQVPRIWDPEVSRVVTGMKEKVLADRAQLDGKGLYQLRCAVCHGEQGMGDGPAADMLYPRPRDFSLGLFKYKTSPGSLPPRDVDLFRTIKDGLPGTGMPGWQALLTDAQIETLIPILKSFDTTVTWAPEDADDEDFDDDGYYLKTDYVSITDMEPVEGQIPYTSESLEKGKAAFEACEKCHGAEGRGNITSGKKLEDDWGYRVWPRDLTKPWSWRATYASGDEAGDEGQAETIKRIYTRLSIGITGTPMPAHREVEEGNKDPISLDDRWHVANYVYSLGEHQQAPGTESVIRAVKMAGALPDNVDDGAWENASVISLRLVPNMIREPRLFLPLNSSVSVRALFNETEIAFLLELNDRTDSRPGEEVSEGIQDEDLTMYPDAFAIQFPKEDAYSTATIVEKPLYRHGDARHGTTIWYHNVGALERVQPATRMLMDAYGPNKKLAPRMEDNSLFTDAKWKHGQWRVVMKRPRNGGDFNDLNFVEGQFIPVSFANWDGSNGETGSKHTLTSWYWLLLPPKMNALKVYGLPAGSGLLVFLIGWWVVRNQRKGSL